MDQRPEISVHPEGFCSNTHLKVSKVIVLLLGPSKNHC